MFVSSVFAVLAIVVAQVLAAFAMFNFVSQNEVDGEVVLAVVLLMVSVLMQVILCKGVCVFYRTSNTRKLILSYIAINRALDSLSTAIPEYMDIAFDAEMARIQRRIRLAHTS